MWPFGTVASVNLSQVFYKTAQPNKKRTFIRHIQWGLSKKKNPCFIKQKPDLGLPVGKLRSHDTRIRWRVIPGRTLRVRRMDQNRRHSHPIRPHPPLLLQSLDHHTKEGAHHHIHHRKCVPPLR